MRKRRYVSLAVLAMLAVGCSGDTGIGERLTTPGGGKPVVYTWPKPIDLAAPFLAVGRTDDDPLPVRLKPDPRSDAVAVLSSLTEPMGVATGNFVKVGNDVWIELTVAGVTGWAPVAQVAQFGSTNDDSKQFAAFPADADMAELADAIARKYVPGGATYITVELQDGPGGHVIVDVLGVPNKIIKGYRIRVEPVAAADAGGYTAGKVLVTDICARATRTGLCI